MNKWTESFAYREEIKIMNFIFVLVIVVALVIALSISQVVKSARVNPSKVLKE
jgi:hypothetical protein